jgi:acyl carrier protein
MNNTPPIVPRQLESVSLHTAVLKEIQRLLAPYQGSGIPIAGDTVIDDGTTVDSLTVMDLIIDLEDRFDIAIPLHQVAAIRTVNNLADTISQQIMR